MCKKAVQKLGVLNIMSSLLDTEKKRLLFNTVMKSHFNYCPLIWIFSSRRSNNLINRIHERSLRTVYNDTSSLFQLLQRNRSVSIHHKNIQTLTTEVFKVVNNICPPIMKTFCDFRENRYNIRKFQEMRQQKERTVRYGVETALYRAPQLWSLVPAYLKSLPDVNLFKSKIKHWECTECPCKLVRPTKEI